MEACIERNLDFDCDPPLSQGMHALRAERNRSLVILARNFSFRSVLQRSGGWVGLEDVTGERKEKGLGKREDVRSG